MGHFFLVLSSMCIFKPAYLPEHHLYWKTLSNLKHKYSSSLLRFIQEQRLEPGEEETIHNAQIIYSLLQSTPETHTFPLHLRLLEAAEHQIQCWVASSLV